MIPCKDAEIRRCVLESLDSRFDQHLAQAENLASLFIALNDERYDIRGIAMVMIGRLSLKNPAYVMPSLRKVLIQVCMLVLKQTRYVITCCLQLMMASQWRSVTLFYKQPSTPLSDL